MNTQPNTLSIPGATVVSVENDTVSFYQHNDTPIERVTLEVNTIAVQVIRYDGDNKSVSVAIGGPFGSIESMPADKVAEYIQAHTQE